MGRSSLRPAPLALLLMWMAGCGRIHYGVGPADGGPVVLPDGRMVDSGGRDSSPGDAETDSAAMDGGLDAGPDSATGDAGTDAGPAVTDTGELTLTPTSSQAREPSIVWSGSEYLVLFDDDRDGNTEIYLARRAPDGTDRGVTRLTDDPAESISVEAVWASGQLAVAWEDSRDGNPEIYLANLDASGARLASDLRLSSTTQDSLNASLAWNGAELGVAWDDGLGGSVDVLFRRAGTDGAARGAATTVGGATGRAIRSSVVWAGSAWAVAWQDDRDGNDEIYFARLDASGVLVSGPTRVTNDPGSSLWPALAWTGAQLGLVWDDDRAGDRDIYFLSLGADGTPTGPIRTVADTAADAVRPALLWTGDEYGLAWSDGDTMSSNIFLARMDATGALLEAPVPVSATAGPSERPTIAWSGASYAIAWEDGTSGTWQVKLRILPP